MTPAVLHWMHSFPAKRMRRGQAHYEKQNSSVAAHAIKDWLSVGVHQPISSRSLTPEPFPSVGSPVSPNSAISTSSLLDGNLPFMIRGSCSLNSFSVWFLVMPSATFSSDLTKWGSTCFLLHSSLQCKNLMSVCFTLPPVLWFLIKKMHPALSSKTTDDIPLSSFRSTQGLINGLWFSRQDQRSLQWQTLPQW